ncbi:LLM class F420-dependent oxidoreductase [Streptomyces sp. NBC_01615]|uniref:LLM class F420-dependent oxidoreductase n=1 Tax=Streptomyces sp. NBC_01615 TaxID=2975898 RepID=UPI003862E758
MPQLLRPFPFGVNMLTPAPADEWRAKCRRAEELGYDVITVADHLGMPAPFPALVAAAEATERPRLGTFVLNAGFWNPALLAREVATTDALTGGRLELGLGTGYVQAEHETAGLPWGSPRERVDHLRRTVEELERLLGSDELPHSRLRSSGGTPMPQAVQRPRVPLLIGANSDRMLRLTAEHADVAAFTGARTLDSGTLAPIAPEELDQRIALYREFAAGRKEPAELNLLIQIVLVTDDPGAAIQPWLPRIPHLTEQQVLELPIVLAGTLEQIVEQLRGRRERYGISYLTVLEPNMEAFAPVVEALRGE